jgi:phospholipase C
MENRDYAEVIGSAAAPFENQLAAQCGAATNYAAIGTPSLPNYIAAISGSTQGIADNNPPASHPLNVASLYTQLATAGLQWRDYEEGAPGQCPSTDSGQYAVRHDPAPYFINIAAACASWDVPMGTASGGNFLMDLSAGVLPAFSFVTPNLCNDTHDCPVSSGDQWLTSWMPIILAAPNYRAGTTAVFLVWDEGNATNRVPEITISPYTPAGAMSATRFDHYSLLKTTEQLLGLPMLGNAGSATSMIPAFFSGGQSSIHTTQ